MIEFADTCHHGMVSVAKALLRWKSVGTHRCSDGCPRQVCRQKIRIIITTASSLAGGGRPHAPDRGAAEARFSLEFLLLWRGDTDDAQTDGANARAHAATPRTRWRSGTAERWFIRSRGRPCGRGLSSVSKRSGTRWSWHWPSGFCHPSSKGCRQRSKPSWATRWRPIGQVIRPPREPASGRRWPRPSRQAMTRRLPLAGVSARDASSAASDQTPDGGRRSRRLRKKY